MIAVDSNILVYAHRRDSRFHERASAVVMQLAEGGRSWGLPWACLHEFTAIVTHPRIYDPPTPVDAAIAQVDAWLGSPSVVLLAEGSGYWGRLRSLIALGAIGPKVHDARIASVCLESGVTELLTADRDYSRFPISVRNPLID